MNLLNAFLFSGIACFIAQIILDNTKLTPGHITSIFTILGALLGFLKIYDKFISFAGSGATVIISNFGYALYKSAYLGFQEQGIIGLFSNLLTKSSCAITGVIIFSFIFVLIFKPKD
jgi:stage V sporulation protein AE